MFTFFSVTELLFDKIGEILVEVVNTVSSIAGASSLVLCVVLIVSAFNKKINRKFFVNNKIFIFVILLLEIVSCLFSQDDKLVKFNCFTMIVCLGLLLLKITKTKKVGTKK